MLIVDENDWDEFVNKHPKGNFFQSAEMYEIYLHSKHHQPFTLCAQDKRGNIVATLAGVIVSQGLPFTSRAIIKGGPLFKSKKALDYLMQQYDRTIGRMVLYTEIRNVYLTKLNYGAFRPELNFLLDLTKGKELIWKGMTKARRNGIAKAKKSLTFGMAKEEDITEIYSILQETYHKAQLPLPDISFFKELFPYGLYFIVRNEGRIIGAMITISFNGILYDWYAASRLDSLKECPNDLLYWGAIEYGIDNNYKTFDFGGAGFKDEPYGPRDFKSQFGGKEITIGRYIRINHPLMFKFSMKCFELTRKWFT